jgi:hypothetical protein
VVAVGRVEEARRRHKGGKEEARRRPGGGQEEAKGRPKGDQREAERRPGGGQEEATRDYLLLLTCYVWYYHASKTGNFRKISSF